MLYAVLFTDTPDSDQIRKTHMADHLAFLEAHADTVRAAGPLSEGGTGAGGLWLVEAADESAVRTLVQADPFWPTGLRATVRILAWTPVFADGARRISP